MPPTTAQVIPNQQHACHDDSEGSHPLGGPILFIALRVQRPAQQPSHDEACRHPSEVSRVSMPLTRAAFNSETTIKMPAVLRCALSTDFGTPESVLRKYAKSAPSTPKIAPEAP